MSRNEPPHTRSPLEVFATAVLRLSLLTGAGLLFYWLQEDSERWNAAMLWLLVGFMALSVWYLAPRVLRNALHWWRERQLLKCVGISAAIGGVLSLPWVVAFLVGAIAGSLVWISFALFSLGGFLIMAVFSEGSG